MLANERKNMNPFNKILLTTMEGYYPVKPEEIIYCRADDSYTHFYLLSDLHYVVSRNLKDFEEVLSPHNFFRIHKSYIININHISMVKKADGVTVLMSNNIELPVSYRKKEAFIDYIKNL